MSADDDGPGQREIAYRVFAAEYDDSTVEHKESDEERAPNYVVSPTGARMNRLFVVGVLTEVEQVNENTKRARIVDPTGAFVVYAGQYQPDAVTALERIDAPAFVAVTGKANTFSPEDSDRVFTSIRPESINEVDADTRDRWTVTTAEHTLSRVATMADALQREERGTDLRAALEAEGVEPGVAAGVPLAIDHYGTTPGYLAAMRDLAIDAAEVVAGEREEVRPLSLSPDDRGTESVALSNLAAGPESGLTGGEGTAEPAAAATPGDSGAGTTSESASETTAETTSGTTTDTTSGTTEPAEETATESTTEPTESAAETTETSSEATGETDSAAEATPESETETEPVTEQETTADATATETATATAGGESGGTESTASVDGDGETAGAAGDDLGDFEPGDLGDEDGEMYEMDEEEREQVKEEHGVEFSTGNEVSEPGEADIETPDAEAEESTGGESATEADAADAEAEDVEEAATDEATTEESTDEAETETEAAADPDDVLMDVMHDLDEGDGAPRDDLVAAVVERTGASEDAVEDAIQDALMGGQCYESGEDRLTPI